MSLGPSSQLPQGFVINGRYEITAPLGRGGQGDVYRVVDHHTSLVGALKLLWTVGPNPWVEAQALAMVAGEYLLPVQNADLASGAPFIVTNLATHGTVEDSFVASVGLPVELAVRWLRQASRGLSRLSDLGLLHNDLKPANLFLDSRGDVLVGDLGFATLLDPATRRGAWRGGTIATTPPEICAQWLAGLTPASQPASVTSDVYGLGATGWWMLTGDPPYSGRDHEAVARAVVAGPPRDLLDAAPHVPTGVREVIRKAMARDPAERYQSPAELDRDLGHFVAPARVWNRTAPHNGHEQCFQGARGASRIEVCVVSAASGSRHQVQVRHAPSGRRTGLPWTTCTSRELPRVLRRVLREST